MGERAALDRDVLIRALDECADRYCEELERSITNGSAGNRAAIVQKAQLLVRCHEMWMEARGDDSAGL